MLFSKFFFRKRSNEQRKRGRRSRQKPFSAAMSRYSSRRRSGGGIDFSSLASKFLALFLLLLALGIFYGSSSVRADGTIELRFAQTHVLDGNGEKTWTSGVENAPLTMHLVGNKKTLALVHLSGSSSADEKPTSGTVTLQDGTVLTLQSSSTLPETFDTNGDVRYAYERGRAMWVDVPREKVQVGMSAAVKLSLIHI